MKDFQIIQSALERAATRRRQGKALGGLWRGLFAGATLALLIALVYHFLPLPAWTLLVAAAAPLAGMLIGLLAGGWRKPEAGAVARWVDSQQHLQERLSTALEVSSRDGSGSWRELVVADAAKHAGTLDVRRLIPFHLPKITRWALVCLALVAGLGFIPEYRSKSWLQKKADQEAIRQAGRQLAEMTRRELDQRSPALPPTQKALESVATLGDELSKASLTRADALRDLASAAEKLKDQIKEMGKDPALKRLEQNNRSSSGGETQTPASLQKQIESLQKQLGSQNSEPDALDKIQHQLEKLQEAAKGLPDKDSPGADAERQKLAQSLSALSRQAEASGLHLPQLDEALAALAANQTDLFLKDLQASLNDLEKLKSLAKTLAQLQQQAEKIGKDLAEQLKNGQPDVAQQTLEKMASELRQGKLSAEQLAKMLQEVSKAIDPASNYGKVADLLKNAAQQMQKGQQPGAAKDLAAAAKELGDLMQQLADAQQMQAALQALNEASFCIGTGQGWRACLGPPRAGKGGKPGTGVGTWASEDGQWDGTSTGGWDNSSVQRPDMDARGHTDRGPGELSDALKPTKVKGQFSPGGQMPSIPLKGVSIKGQSRVAYEEAATAAQSEAQSALSQSKVPRAYQGAVKDYFDDLKK